MEATKASPRVSSSGEGKVAGRVFNVRTRPVLARALCLWGPAIYCG